MKISTKGTYGLRAMIDLALYSRVRPVSLSTIARRQEISELYLEQIFARLRKNGLVASKRGVQGGYYLKKDPRDITVREILETLEGGILEVGCQEAGDAGCQKPADGEKPGCRKHDVCPTRVLWGRINNAVTRVLDSCTLYDMVIEAQYRDDTLPQ